MLPAAGRFGGSVAQAEAAVGLPLGQGFATREQRGIIGLAAREPCNRQQRNPEPSTADTSQPFWVAFIAWVLRPHRSVLHGSLRFAVRAT
jgi:hypothetical protein